MNKEELRNLAENHWEYTKNIIVLTKGIEECEVDLLDLIHYLYTEALMHGYKHCIEEYEIGIKKV